MAKADYKCTTCGSVNEYEIKTATTCSSCGATTLKRIWTSTPIIYKADGFTTVKKG